MDPKQIARVVAIGRVTIGAALLIAPGRATRGWIGASDAARGSSRALARSLGARDAVLGAIALHTLDHPEVGPRWQRTCAAVDAVDAAATLAVARELPPAGAVGVAVTGVVAAATGLWVSRALA